MKLLVGLGNPGGKYKNNRHNVGHRFIDEIVRSHEFVVGSDNWKLVKSDVFMNQSGEFVKKVVTSHQPLATSNLYVVHDDLDIRLGGYKIQLGVGPKVHYGIQSIENELRTKDFWRIRIGVDNRGPNNRTPGEKYVLEDFTKKEIEILDSLFPKLWDDLIKLCKI